MEKLDAEMTSLLRRGYYTRAAKVAEKSIRIATQSFGAQHALTQSARDNLEKIRLAQGKRKQEREQAAAAAAKPWPSESALLFKVLPAVVVAVLFLAAVLLTDPSSMLSGDGTGVSAAPVHEDNALFPHYQVRAHFDPERSLIVGQEGLTFTLDKPQTRLVLNLYLNRQQNLDLTTSEVRSYALRRGSSPGSITILKVTGAKGKLDYQVAGDKLEIMPPPGGFTAGEHQIEIDFQIKIPAGADRSGGNQQGIWLGHWLPTMAPETDQALYAPTEIGDPYFNHTSTYAVQFTLPHAYELVLSNTEVVEENSQSRIYAGTLVGVRDLPVFIHRGYRQAEAAAGSVRIRYFYRHGDAPKVLRAAQAAVDFYSAAVGPYPWSQLNIVENDMYLHGMEYATLILISERVLRGDPEPTIFHEVGHQWFYNLVGNDPYQDPFLDEGLVEFLTKYALDDPMPQKLTPLPDLRQNLADFDNWRQYREVHYEGGEKFFANLYYVLGEEKFIHFVQSYFQRYQYQLVSWDDFSAFFREQTGRPLNLGQSSD